MKYLITLILLCFTTLGFADDRVKVQVQFRKLIFHCQDGTDEIVDASMSGGTPYELTCKSDGKWTNSFTNYSGNLSFTPDEYEKTDSKEMADAKTAEIDKWIYQVKNPPPYVEPTVEDYKNMLESKIQEVNQMTDSMAKIATKEEMESIKTKLDSASTTVSSQITAIEVKPK